MLLCLAASLEEAAEQVRPGVPDAEFSQVGIVAVVQGNDGAHLLGGSVCIDGFVEELYDSEGVAFIVEGVVSQVGVLEKDFVVAKVVEDGDAVGVGAGVRIGVGVGAVVDGGCERG